MFGIVEKGNEYPFPKINNVPSFRIYGSLVHLVLQKNSAPRPKFLLFDIAEKEDEYD